MFLKFILRTKIISSKGSTSTKIESPVIANLMKRNIADQNAAVYKIEHHTPACEPHTILVCPGDLRIVWIDPANDLLEFRPATKMNNRKQNEESPEIRQQACQHHNAEDQR